MAEQKGKPAGLDDIEVVGNLLEMICDPSWGYRLLALDKVQAMSPQEKLEAFKKIWKEDRLLTLIPQPLWADIAALLSRLEITEKPDRLRQNLEGAARFDVHSDQRPVEKQLPERAESRTGLRLEKST